MKKNKLILLQLFIAFTLICTSVYATVNTTIAVSASKTSVFRGDTVSVTLSLENVNSAKKVESVAGYINYNKDVIETIDVNSIQKNENNTVTIGNETLKVEDLTNSNVNDLPTSTSYIAFNGAPTSGNDSRIVIDFKDGITEDTELLTVDFKVKSDATIGEIEKAISYSLFVVTADSEESEEITKNVNLTIKAVQDNDNNDNTNNDNNNDDNDNDSDNDNQNANTNTNTNSNTNKNTNTNTNTNTNSNTNNNVNTNTNSSNTNSNTDGTVAGVNLPATGAKIIIVPAIILIILAYVSYNRYIKYKDI